MQADLRTHLTDGGGGGGGQKKGFRYGPNLWWKLCPEVTTSPFVGMITDSVHVGESNRYHFYIYQRD